MSIYVTSVCLSVCASARSMRVCLNLDFFILLAKIYSSIFSRAKHEIMLYADRVTAVSFLGGKNKSIPAKLSRQFIR